MKLKNLQNDQQDKADVLIALAAQESETVDQPPSPEELKNFFENSKRFPKQRQNEILAYLDSHPQAYERWIKQGKQAAQSKRTPALFSIMPYAIAACAALLIVGTVLLFRGQSFKLDQAVDHAYQAAASKDDPETFQQTMASLTDSLQATDQPLSFSQAGQLSLLAEAFTLGLKRDWQTFTNRDDFASAQQSDYHLGRWYALLWTIAQQNRTMPADFWEAQLDILDHLKTHYAERTQEMDTTQLRSVGLQLERMQAPLLKLAENSQDTRPYQQLEQMLTALHYGLVHSL